MNEIHEVDENSAVPADELTEYNTLRRVLEQMEAGVEVPKKIRDIINEICSIDVDALIYAQSDSTPLYLLIKKFVPDIRKITISTSKAAIEIMYPENDDTPVEALGYPVRDGERLWIHILLREVRSESSPAMQALLM